MISPEEETNHQMDWNKYLKVDLIDGRETATYVNAKELVEIAKKEGVDFESVRSKFGTKLEIPDFEVIVNKLGYSVEKGISNLVWMLNAKGIITSQSCEGHPDRSNKNPNPNIELSEEMATRALAVMDGWDGVGTNDVVFSRMLANEGGNKSLVEIDFMDPSLVNSWVKFLTSLS